MTLEDMLVNGQPSDGRKEALDEVLLDLHRRFGSGAVKTGDELMAERRFEENSGI
jgi:hypothetical protein